MSIMPTRWHDEPARCCDDERDLLLEATWRREAEHRARRKRRQARRILRARRYLVLITGWTRLKLRDSSG